DVDDNMIRHSRRSHMAERSTVAKTCHLFGMWDAIFECKKWTLRVSRITIGAG
ncbi:uncharacterized protein BJ212DRAFT_1412485, partial [Suillus subaureus]